MQSTTNFEKIPHLILTLLKNCHSKVGDFFSNFYCLLKIADLTSATDDSSEKKNQILNRDQNIYVRYQ